MAGYAEYGLAAQTAQDQSFFDTQGQFVIQPVRVRFTFLDPVAIKNEYPKLFDKYGSCNLSVMDFNSFSKSSL